MLIPCITQNNLKKTISDIVTEEEFYRYQNSDFPNCWIGAVDFKTANRLIINIKEKKYTYEDYIQLTNASASIPLVVEGVKEATIAVTAWSEEHNIIHVPYKEMFDMTVIIEQLAGVIKNSEYYVE